MFLTNLIERAATLWPDRLSLVHEGREFTWRQTRDRIERLAWGLSAITARRGCSIVVLGLSEIAYFELSYAIPTAGLVFVPMNIRMSDEELRHLIAQLDVGAIVYGPGFADKIARLRQLFDFPAVHWGDGGGDDDSADYEQLIADAQPTALTPLAADETWAIIFTGGTTGMPKGVQLTHAAIAYNVMCILQDIPWEENWRFLQVSPLFHLAGLGPSFAMTAKGATHFFLPEFSATRLLEKLAAHGCDCTNLVPTMISMMLMHPDIDSFDLSNLKSLCYGASAIPLPTLERVMARLPGIRFAQFYGQTESCGGLTVLREEHHVSHGPHVGRLQSAGRAVFGVDVAILDAQGREVPRGTWGEICGRSPGLFQGYLGHPELTAEAKRGGWLHTGDIGYMDDDGFVYVTDRLKDMIVTGGENVSSSEVETVILTHAMVQQVAVIGAPDAVWGERIHAFIVTPQPDGFDLDALVAHCRAHIAGYKIPKSFTVQSAALPLSAVGKVRKDVLRAQLSGHTPPD